MFQYRFAGFRRVALLINVVELSVFINIVCYAEDITRWEEIPRVPKPKGTAAIQRHIVDYPYLAAVLHGDKHWEHPFKFLCSGAIISDRYLITTASCLASVSPFMILINVGSNVLPKNDASSWSTLLDVEDILLHLEFQPRKDKDIGLIKTTNPIIFTSSIQPVKLQQRNVPFNDQALVMVSGWGGIKDTKSGTMSYHVMVVDIPVINRYQCWETFKKAYTTFTKNMWCSDFYHMGDDDKFEGDHGSPAVQHGALVGVMSYTHYRRVEIVYPLFANIGSPEIRDFINQTAGV